MGIDSVQDQVVHGSWSMPKEGDSLATPRGGTAKWRSVKAGADGGFGNLGSGYLAASVAVESDRVMLLEAQGDGMVYVNGVPRPGDPYENKYLRLPVLLHRGINTFLFAVGRGELKARLISPRNPAQIETDDLTRPDILLGGAKELWAGIVVLNSTQRADRFQIATTNSSQEVATVTADIPAMSFRKVPIRLVVPQGDLGKEQKFEVSCTVGSDTDIAKITVPVKKQSETHRETFISQIDGSLQYYGVNPAQKPSTSNALILSLHGAGVEAIGQASAYSNKDWCTLVAPTNRRPYGFDWEDIGRLDALEVLRIAKKEFAHDPASVHLTGHSMGGHGTWAIGTLYPDLFASIAPSAGWISFWSYAGGFSPQNPSQTEQQFFRAMSPSDTLARVSNTLEEKLYILHGDKDDNVPVSEARHMKQVLTSLHADFEYHEEPGASHWWGAQCVDWPPLFEQIRTTRLAPRLTIDFTTPSPAVSARDQWVTILEQIYPMVISHVQISDTDGKTENVQALRVDKAFDSLTLDGQKLGSVRKGSVLIKSGGAWAVGKLRDGAKSPQLSGPFKNAYQNNFVFVVGTHGTREENAWAAEKARFDAESFEYRGNGSVDIVTDRQYNPGWQRNAILYGNADTNSAWKVLLSSCPLQVDRSKVTLGGRVMAGDDLAALFVYPHKASGKWVLVGAIAGTGMTGMRTTDRLAVFTSGVAYPDWTVLSSEVLKDGAKGVKANGFFDNDWRLTQ